MPPAQDHKRALDGDEGLNTGGMGAYCPASCVGPQLFQEIEKMCQTTVEKMLDPLRGPQVLEFNCRFGDPETQVLLPLLDSDLYQIMSDCCDGNLGPAAIQFRLPMLLSSWEGREWVGGFWRYCRSTTRRWGKKKPTDT
mmetsp:Transcript_42129/g.98740  ORF Transcript_42129/g.98740 Transcript_42129/m.98740 type:complete len:139 (-) Transcript_42129:177-593(-)